MWLELGFEYDNLCGWKLFSFVRYMVNHTQVNVGSPVKYLCVCKGMKNVWTYFVIGKVSTLFEIICVCDVKNFLWCKEV